MLRIRTDECSNRASAFLRVALTLVSHGGPLRILRLTCINPPPGANHGAWCPGRSSRRTTGPTATARADILAMGAIVLAHSPAAAAAAATTIYPSWAPP